jgi:hypothetical protein
MLHVCNLVGSKFETHFGDCLSVSCWRITSPSCPNITEFPSCSRARQKQGIQFGGDFTLRINQTLYLEAGIFLDDMRTILLSYIDSLRGRAVLAQEIAVLLMDNCSAHVIDDVIRVLTEARVRVIAFASHATQVFQVLDLTIFGVLKRVPTYELPFEDDNSTVKVITKVYHGFMQTLVPS